jgi:hypothetical protein
MKEKINVSNAVNDYKIQIFSGDMKKKNTLAEFRQAFSGMDGTIIFNTPNYKVWVGNYKSRIEAERNLIDIKIYPNVHLIQQGNSTFYKENRANCSVFLIYRISLIRFTVRNW